MWIRLVQLPNAPSFFWRHARGRLAYIFSLETNGLVAVPPSLSWHWHGLLIERSCLTHCSAICQKGTTKSLRLQLIWCGPVCCNRCRLETWNLLFYIDENSGQCKYAGGQPTDLSHKSQMAAPTASVVVLQPMGKKSWFWVGVASC